ncbi:MAG: SAM-dependent methyltransferase [Lachnospiraceae bacterium]|nr:SAM-dependent methyltransferase [Lachnospiraceae bacterium]
MAKTYTPKLSPRLEGIVSLVPPCGSVADIGCDHGYVSIALLQRGISKRAVACDIKEGPLEHARKNIGKAGLSDTIDVRCAPGLSSVSGAEAEVIVIAGMGQRTIAGILDDNPEIAGNAEYLVLQPQSEIPEMREYLEENGYTVLKNRLMREGEKYYFAILASAKHSTAPGEENFVVKKLREKKDVPELERYSKTLDTLFGLDLIYTDKEMAYYLSHVIGEWEGALKKLSEAKKPDFEKIKMLELKKESAQTALEMNTLFCGIDEKLRSMFDREFIKRSEEE